MATQVPAASQGASGASGKESSNQFASLYVGDLTPEVTEAVLYEIFNAIGPVASIRVCRDSVTRRSLGYAYVNFHQAADAERATEALNYTEIKGNPCRIMWCHRDPSARRNPASNIYIKNLDKSIDNRSLYDTFSVFGNVLSCKIGTDAEGKSRGFAFVHFETEEAATASIEKCNGMQLGEKTIFVGPFHKQSDRPASEKPFSNIYVKHIPETMDEEALKALFTPFGEITSLVINTDAKGRRFGFVNFKDFNEAKDAVTELHGKDLRTDEEKSAELTEEQTAELEENKEDDIYTYQLYVVRAQTKEERHAVFKARTSASGEVAVEAAKPAAPQNSNLYIKNLSETVDDDELTKMFEPFGTITSAKIMRDDKSVSRCFGFVNFSTPEEATRAVTEMHLKLVNGKPLYVGLHERREQRMDRLQQRYRMNPMMAAGGMGGQQRMPAQFGGMYAQQQQQQQGGQFYRPMPQQQRMAPQLSGFQQQQQRGMSGYPMMGNMINPQAAAAMRAAQVGQQPNIMMNPAMAGMARPGMPMRGVPMMQQQQRPQGQFAYNQQARNMSQGQAQQPQGSWPEPGQFDPAAPLTAAALAAAPPTTQKQMLGEKLFPQISKIQPELAGKITGMMLEMDNSELLILLESEAQLRSKVDEAIRVLQG